MSTHDNLDDAFALPTTNHTRGMMDLLPPQKPRPTPAAQPQVTPKPAAKVKAGEKTPIVSVPVYLPPATFTAVQDAIHAQRTTYAGLAIQAFRAISDDRLAAYFASPEPQDEIPGLEPKRTGRTGIQRQFRFHAATKAYLQAKGTDVGAPSLSALVATVIGIHLGTADQ